MNPIQKFFKSLTKGLRQPFTANISTLFASTYSGMFGKKDYIAEYKNWTYACASARAEDVANIDLELWKGDQKLDSHIVLDLLHMVNPLMTKHDLFYATQTFKDLDGNCFWFLAREDRKDGKGEIKEIYILRPDKMKIVTSKENPLMVEGYIYVQNDGKQIPFQPSEIIHHKNFNPNGAHPFPHRGMGVVEAAYATVNLDNEMRKYNTGFFNNSARPDGLLIMDQEGTAAPEDYRRLREQWAQEHQGSDNAYKVAVVNGVKWQEISRSQTDMQFNQSLTANRDEIMALFHVPKTILGITDDVNRANADAAIYVFTLKTIKPLMQKIVDTLNEFLLPNFGDEQLEFRFKSPVSDDKDANRADNEAALDKWMTRNEIRATMGLPPSEQGDSFFMPFNVAPMDSVTPEKNAASKVPTKKETKKKTKGQELVDKFTAQLPKSNKAYKTISNLAKTQYIEMWKNHLNISNAPLKKKLINYFDKQEAQVQKNLKEEMKGLDAKEFKLKAIQDILFDEDQAISAGINLITPFIADYIKRSGEQATVLAGGTEFDLTTAIIQQFIPKRAQYFADSVNGTTSDDLLKTIQEGINNGESLDSISQRISDVYNIAKGSRTDTIARTEVSASSNFGSIQAYLQAGVENHQWVVVSPDDEDCLDNDGDIEKIGEAFPSGDEDPPVHPNCECTTIPVFEE